MVKFPGSVGRLLGMVLALAGARRFRQALAAVVPINIGVATAWPAPSPA